ncbi:MAG: hypothetical protein AUG44_25885 [Actinobacteria bacterium 13_1_20CM_3_71_11]|nr:MAG: hypothetical protein AUG44_25885 [Actinobacteria bacterium 13_1_20CM_3_71_11]
MNGGNIYLHGFTQDGRSVGQTGQYLPDQVSAIRQGRKALRRMGARRVVQVEAADPAAAAVLAEEILRESAGVAEEPWSPRDRIGYVVAAVSLKASVAWARWVRRRRS